MYNIENENPFEGRLLVCKVANKLGVFPSEWEVWKRSLQECCKFFKCEKLFLQVFESIKFQGVSVWKKILQVVEDFIFEV